MPALQRPGQFQGLAFQSEGSRDPCVPSVPTDSISFTNTVPTSIYSVPSGEFAWKCHEMQGESQRK